MSKYGVFSGLYLPVFRLSTGKYRPEKTPYFETFRTVLILVTGARSCWFTKLIWLFVHPIFSWYLILTLNLITNCFGCWVSSTWNVFVQRLPGALAIFWDGTSWTNLIFLDKGIVHVWYLDMKWWVLLQISDWNLVKLNTLGSEGFNIFIWKKWIWKEELYFSVKISQATRSLG